MRSLRVEWSSHVCHRCECKRTGFRPQQSPGRQTGLSVALQRCSGPPLSLPFPSSWTHPDKALHPHTPREARAWSEALGPGRGSACSAGPAAVCLQLLGCLREEFWYQGDVSSRHRAFSALLKGSPPAAPQRVLGREPGRRQPREPVCLHGHGCGRETFPSLAAIFRG